MPRVVSQKALDALKFINTRASEIQKEHPEMKRKECVKQASCEYRANKAKENKE